LINVNRSTGALTDVTDAHIVVVDVPSLLVPVVGAAAGELGDGRSSRRAGRE
jgi:hypothetical protein